MFTEKLLTLQWNHDRTETLTLATCNTEIIKYSNWTLMKNFNPMCMIVSSVTRFTLFNNIKFEIPHELPELKDEENEKSSEYNLGLLIICISNVSQVSKET
ncbi:hypothetical protein T4A_11836 [Trichinella pseudospiralis]|uniref:Uncharacterized protein n=1 Tax=Trichinella pseudospiralis TaxID=6337 RepID=A0A0V1E5I7_TRIPS|nr:hypothetical protein T4A_11836 [Trichinella pseudospiralis]